MRRRVGVWLCGNRCLWIGGWVGGCMGGGCKGWMDVSVDVRLRVSLCSVWLSCTEIRPS